MRRLLVLGFSAAIILGTVACGEGEVPYVPVREDAGVWPDGSIVAHHDAGDGMRPDAGPAGPDAGPVGQDAANPGPDAQTGDPCTQPGIKTIVALQVIPAAVTVEKGLEELLTVNATFDTGCVSEVTGSVYYRSSDSAIAAIVDVPGSSGSTLPGKAVRGLAWGSATLTISTGADGAGVRAEPVVVTVTESTPVPTETRGVWVTRFAYANATDVRRIVNAAADNNFNAVFFQVRGVGDAFYRSKLVPWWKKDSSGRLGVDPGWDPLQVAVDTAHARGIELHAYINAMSGWPKSGTTPGVIPDSVQGAPQHILKQHPEWTCLNAAGNDDVGEYSYIAADPGYRDHLAAVAEEIVKNYQVDGIHLDRIRTPGRAYCHSPGLDALFKQRYGTDTTKFAQFQREQLDLTMKAVYDKVVAANPKVVVSAAVWGIYKRLPGCSTSEGYGDYHQDALGWMKQGIIDMLNPMIYWDLKAGSCTDWGALVDQFVAGANGRMIVAGMHALEGSVANFPRVAARIGAGRARNIPGHIVFASTYLDSQSLWDDYLAGPYQTKIDPTPITHR